MESTKKGEAQAIDKAPMLKYKKAFAVQTRPILLAFAEKWEQKKNVN